MIKVVIANNNDILYDSLSNIALKNEAKIELFYMPLDKVRSLVYGMKKNENLMILDSSTSVSLCVNILKNMSNRLDKESIIILVVDSKQITNIVSHEKNYSFFKKQTNILSIVETINSISDTVKNTTEAEKKIDDILWQLGFPSYFKATNYIKDAILLAYMHEELLQISFKYFIDLCIRYLNKKDIAV